MNANAPTSSLHQVVLKFLSKVHIKADTAVDGVECTEKVFSRAAAADEGADAGQYSIILCDLHMPNKDGYQTCKEIRKWERERGRGHLPIIALSANVLGDVYQKCVEAGFNSEYSPSSVAPAAGDVGVAACADDFSCVMCRLHDETGRFQGAEQSAHDLHGSQRSEQAARVHDGARRWRRGEAPQERRAAVDGWAGRGNLETCLLDVRGGDLGFSDGAVSVRRLGTRGHGICEPGDVCPSERACRFSERAWRWCWASF